jgi:hypothetical protein
LFVVRDYLYLNLLVYSHIFWLKKNWVSIAYHHRRERVLRQTFTSWNRMRQIGRIGPHFSHASDDRHESDLPQPSFNNSFIHAMGWGGRDCDKSAKKDEDSVMPPAWLHLLKHLDTNRHRRCQTVFDTYLHL